MEDQKTPKMLRTSYTNGALDGVNWETFTGHVWRVSVIYESGPNPDFMEQQFPEDVAQSGSSAPFVLGRILFEDEGLG